MRNPFCANLTAFYGGTRIQVRIKKCKNNFATFLKGFITSHVFVLLLLYIQQDVIIVRSATAHRRNAIATQICVTLEVPMTINNIMCVELSFVMKNKKN